MSWTGKKTAGKAKASTAVEIEPSENDLKNDSGGLVPAVTPAGTLDIGSAGKSRRIASLSAST